MRQEFTAFALLLLAAWRIPAAGSAAQKKSKREIIASECLLYGTVFTDRGFALPGAEVKMRQTTEKKAKWEAHSDRRGEFAIRVPGGAEYEISVKAKGFEPMTRTVNAPVGGRQDMVFRLQPAADGNKK